MTRGAIFLALLLVSMPTQSRAAAFTDATPCGQFTAAMQQDTGAVGDKSVERDHVVQLLGLLKPFMPAGPDGRPSPIMLTSLIGHTQHLCTLHPDWSLGRTMTQVQADLKQAQADTAGEKPDAAAMESLGLFSSACLAHDDAGALRKWASGFHLALLPPGFDAALRGTKPGESFNASNTTVKVALVSFDDGACEVVAEHGSAPQFERAMTLVADQGHFALDIKVDRNDPARHVTQREYLAHGNGWQQLLSVTTRPYADVAIPPMIVVLSTPRYAR